nr:Plasmodium exported protein (PHISTa), unknown, putative [Plasmodium sp. DRC-Itaito]
MHGIGFALSSTDMKNTNNFYKLVKDGTSICEMKNCTYAFIKYYDTLKNDLFNEHKTIFTERMKNPQKLDMST